MEQQQYLRGQRVVHRDLGPSTVYQDRGGATYIYIAPDKEKNLVMSVREADLGAAE